jgi:hypothetical protein
VVVCEIATHGDVSRIIYITPSLARLDAECALGGQQAAQVVE